MADESHSFSTARTRLEEIVTQVRKKDTSLEKSLDLLEEGVRLANACTELIDHADWVSAENPVGEGAVGSGESEPDGAAGAEGQVAVTATDVASDSGVDADVADAIEAVEEAFEGAADSGSEAQASDGDADDDGYDDAWADDETPADELAADDDPSADER